MAAEITKRYGITPELIPSGGGVFEVLIDGRLAFSKKRMNRFPEVDEVFAAIDEQG